MLCAFRVAKAEVFILTELTQCFALLGSVSQTGSLSFSSPKAQMVSTATMQKSEQLLSLLAKAQSGLLKLVRARFHAQIISDVTFEAG